MNSDLLQFTARKFITALGGYLIGRGILTETELTPQLIDAGCAALLFLASSLWSKAHYQKAKENSESDK